MFLTKINAKIIESEDYFRILDGILEIVAMSKETDEMKQFLLAILKPWASKFIEISQKKVNTLIYYPRQKAKKSLKFLRN